MYDSVYKLLTQTLIVEPFIAPFGVRLKTWLQVIFCLIPKNFRLLSLMEAE